MAYKRTSKKSGSNDSKKSKADYARILVENVVKAVEEGHDLPWRKTWTDETRPRNAVTGRPYTGVNVIIGLLGMMVGGFSSGLWLAKGQMKSIGGWFRKGEKPTWMWRPLTKKFEDENGDDQYRTIGFAVFPVWNVEQLKPGYDESKIWKDPNADKGEDNDPIEECEKVVGSYPEPPAMKRGNPAYRPSNDSVYMPTRKDFVGSEEYYSALFHELAHSTGHAKRLGRAGVKGAILFGSQEYSREELVAEIASNILCSMTGVAPKVIDNQTAYVKGWLKYLQDDPGALADAASAAQKAVDHILGTNN